MATERMAKPSAGRKALPVLGKSTQPTGASVESQAIRQGAVATSHNTFRPDIYRVSEGYLN